MAKHFSADMIGILPRILSAFAPRRRRLVRLNPDDFVEELGFASVDLFGRIGHSEGARKFFQNLPTIFLDPLLPHRLRRNRQRLYKQRRLWPAAISHGEVPILLVKELLGGSEDLLLD